MMKNENVVVSCNLNPYFWGGVVGIQLALYPLELIHVMLLASLLLR